MQLTEEGPERDRLIAEAVEALLAAGRPGDADDLAGRLTPGGDPGVRAYVVGSVALVAGRVRESVRFAALTGPALTGPALTGPAGEALGLAGQAGAGPVAAARDGSEAMGGEPAGPARSAGLESGGWVRSAGEEPDGQARLAGAVGGWGSAWAGSGDGWGAGCAAWSGGAADVGR